MKKIIILLLMLIVNIVTFAQEKTADEKATELTKKMKEQVGFKDEVTEKVQAVNLEFVKKTEEIKASDSGKMSKMKEFKAADENRDTKLKEVLSEDEYAKFKDKKSDNRKELKERFKANRNK
ncbi:MAG: hypothetical protein KYX68_10510 [Flavobacterium sp.]|nr:hypothetical protein [Flavobacterium sp.]